MDCCQSDEKKLTKSYVVTFLKEDHHNLPDEAVDAYTAPSKGVISKILVSDGGRVQAGQTLVVINRIESVAASIMSLITMEIG